MKRTLRIRVTHIRATETAGDDATPRQDQAPAIDALSLPLQDLIRAAERGEVTPPVTERRPERKP